MREQQGRRALGRAASRFYFAVQAIAGALWWLLVFADAHIRGVGVRQATLGYLDPAVVAAFDIPLFVIASALAAAAIGWAVRLACLWTLLVALGMAGFATVTGQAGIGAVLMIAAAAASLGSGLYILCGRIPAQLLFIGPFRFQHARNASRFGPMTRTVIQLVEFWGLFLLVIPLALVAIEARWQLAVELPANGAWTVRLLGLVVLAAASALGVWSARTMAKIGNGTPLPSDMANSLVTRGPYRYVRNPMAVAGVAQGAAVGLLMNSWIVLVYALAGSLVWNWLIRPYEEADLAERFGPDFSRYCEAVSCWVPRRSSPAR